MVNASASKYSTTHSACLAFYVAQVSDFVSQLSRVTFYGFVSRSVSGCLEPENKIYRAVFSPTGWIINIYSPVLPLSCSHWNWRELYIYKQRQKQTGKPSPSVLTRTKIPVRNWQASLFVSCLAYFLSPFRTCEGIGLVSLLAVTGDSSIFGSTLCLLLIPPASAECLCGWGRQQRSRGRAARRAACASPGCSAGAGQPVLQEGRRVSEEPPFLTYPELALLIRRAQYISSGRRHLFNWQYSCQWIWDVWCSCYSALVET